MGSFSSKNKQPERERKKSIATERVLTSDGHTTKTSSVTMTKAVKISQTVTSTRTSVNSVTSQMIRSGGTTATISPAVAKGPELTYSPIYNRPSLTVSPDASVVTSPTHTRNLSNEFGRSQISNTPYRAQDTAYDLTKQAYVLVFHNYKFKNSEHNRLGSSKDMQKIKEILSEYRCERLDINENYTAREIQLKMQKISTQNFTKNSCLIVFIMSHGEINDTIMGYDGRMYSFHDDIVEQCTANRTLRGKPKIFVVQACRGEAAMETDARRFTISDKSDLVAFQSSYHDLAILGTLSYRHIEEGSTFMQAFLRLLHANNQQSIINVNAALNKEFKERKLGQAPTLTTTLQKELIFGKLLRGS